MHNHQSNSEKKETWYSYPVTLHRDRDRGSSLAMLIGIFAIIMGVTSFFWKWDPIIMTISGVAITSAATAYQSVRNRRIGGQHLKAEVIKEAVCITILILLIVLGIFFDLVKVHPITFIIIPIWGILMYKIAYDGVPAPLHKSTAGCFHAMSGIFPEVLEEASERVLAKKEEEKARRSDPPVSGDRILEKGIPQ